MTNYSQILGIALAIPITATCWVLPNRGSKYCLLLGWVISRLFGARLAV